MTVQDVGDGIKPGPFNFEDPHVVDNFDRHVAHSVPGYGDAQDCMAALGRHFAQADTKIIDIGCATGTTSAKLFEGGWTTPKGCRTVLMDPSSNMLDAAYKKVAMAASGTANILTRKTALGEPGGMDEHIGSASVIFCAFTLQFVPPAVRAAALGDMADTLAPGGVLLLFEKQVPINADMVDPMRQSHHDIKELEGYTREQIAAKDRALRGTMHPRRLNDFEWELAQAGLVGEPVWRSLMFGGYACLKA
tara:strand:- start:3810 stop:4556 length:747 start_codon:yes stop_codon:yes gene_type:complete